MWIWIEAKRNSLLYDVADDLEKEVRRRDKKRKRFVERNFSDAKGLTQSMQHTIIEPLSLTLGYFKLVRLVEEETNDQKLKHKKTIVWHSIATRAKTLRQQYLHLNLPSFLFICRSNLSLEKTKFLLLFRLNPSNFGEAQPKLFASEFKSSVSSRSERSPTHKKERGTKTIESIFRPTN